MIDSSFLVAVMVDSTETNVFSVAYILQADQSGQLIDEESRMDDAGAQTFGGVVTYTERGQPTGFEPFADDPKLFKRFRGYVMGLMNAPWLPAEPVGIGAKWRIHTPVSLAQPVRSDKVTLSELVSIEGSVIAIETTTTTDSPKQKINGKQIEGQKIRSTKRTSVDLTDPVSVLPRSWDLSQDIERTLLVAGKEVTQGMSTSAKVRRISDAVASE